MAHQRYSVSRKEAGRTLADWLRARLSVPRPEAVRLLRAHQVRLDGVPCSDPMRRLRPGQRIQVFSTPARKRPQRTDRPPRRQQATDEGRPRRGPRLVLRHVDEQMVVVDKPPGLTTMRHAEEIAEFGSRGRRYLPPTLADLLPPLLAKGHPGRHAPVLAVHRLDKDTSGLLVFARTPGAQRNLGKQLRAHTVERLYLAVVRGRAQSGRIESWLVRDRGDGRRGSSPTPGTGQRAVTHVRVVEELGDYTLVECRLETGRTHQVRIHLGEAGTPLCGERIYDRPPHGKPVPDNSKAPRIALHAAQLALDHPTTGERLHWTAPLPPDLAFLVKRLRRRAGKGKE
jgi:23S rRNA pseudouridine1911/1915/1917 synthase